MCSSAVKLNIQKMPVRSIWSTMFFKSNVILLIFCGKYLSIAECKELKTLTIIVLHSLSLSLALLIFAFYIYIYIHIYMCSNVENICVCLRFSHAYADLMPLSLYNDFNCFFFCYYLKSILSDLHISVPALLLQQHGITLSFHFQTISPYSTVYLL